MNDLSTLFLDLSNNAVDIDMVKSSPETAIKALISKYHTEGFSQSFLFPLISTVLAKNDSLTKRTLYWYFETIINEASFSMCISQISRDLSSPNEFVRGLALKLTSKVRLVDYANVSSVKDCLFHHHHYVRKCAVSCISSIGTKFDLLDIKDDLISLYGRERNPKVISALLVSFDQLHIEIDDVVTRELLSETSSKPIDEVLNERGFLYETTSHLVRFTNSESLLMMLAEIDNDEIAFLASMKLLRKRNFCFFSKIISILKRSSVYLKDFTSVIPMLKETFQLLPLIGPFEFNFSQAVVSHVLEHTVAKDAPLIAEVLYGKYIETGSSSTERINFRHMLLSQMNTLVRRHFVYEPALISEALDSLRTEGSNPEVLFHHLQFLKTVNQVLENSAVSSSLVDVFDKIAYGKILRLVFEVISLNISKDLFVALINKICLCLNAPEASKDFPFLSSKFEVFSGVHICMLTASMYQEEFDCKPLVISMILKFIEYGKKSLLMDISSHSTLLTVLRAFIKNNTIHYSPAISYESFSEQKSDCLELPKFTCLGSFCENKTFKWNNAVCPSSNTVQLTGMDDLMYVECNVFIHKSHCLLDFLMINQTDFLFKNIELEMVTTNNLVVNTDEICPVSLQADSATIFTTKVFIVDSTDSFISGTIRFECSGTDAYSSSTVLHKQHLSEIRIKIQDFLFPAKIMDFSSQWTDLPWENLYSAVISSKFSITDKFNSLVKSVNGHVCSYQYVSGILVANIACYTLQKNLICLNVCMVDKTSSLEVRIRSTSESIIKSISGVVRKSLIKC